METCTVDTTLLESKLSGLMGVLIGNGASSGDLQNAIRVEAGQTAWRIAQSIGPTSRERGVSSITKQAREYFRPQMPGYNLEAKSYPTSKYATRWLSAGPNVLMGVGEEDYLPNAGVVEALELFRASQKGRPRGKVFPEVGRRGKQHIVKMNRMLISQRTYTAMIKAVAASIGQSKASWAATAAMFLPKRPIPAWVQSQIKPALSRGKVILNDRLTGLTGFVEFGSRAKGVESNPVLLQKIRAGITGAEKSLAAKFQKVIAGHTYNFNTGQVFPSVKVEDN